MKVMIWIELGDPDMKSRNDQREVAAEIKRRTVNIGQSIRAGDTWGRLLSAGQVVGKWSLEESR